MSKKNIVEITNEGQTAVVAFKETSITDTETIAAVQKQIVDFIDANQPQSIVVDFENVKFFASQLLGMLLGVRAKLQQYDGRVVISAIDPRLHKIFNITNLDKIFDFFPDKDSAVSAAGRA